jgi:hypothetical protein
MKTNTRAAECRRIREALLDACLEGRDEGTLPGEAREHFQDCPGCARYREGVLAGSRLFPGAPLFTPALRQRTLARVADKEAERPSWLAPALVPASAAGVAFSVIAPIWLLTSLLRPFLGSEWLALGFAILVSGSAGLAATALGLAALARRREEGFPLAPVVLNFLEVPRE